jgi:23S rRNA (cytosine1962-C5)-methyltransferase
MRTFIDEVTNNYRETNQFVRLFHGRGKAFEGFDFLTVDSIPPAIFGDIFTYDEKESEIIAFLETFATQKNRNLLVRRRYDNFRLTGDVLPSFALEGSMRFLLDFSKQNIGYFGDIRPVREYVRKHALNKRILNLFSYTCGFSMAAKQGGAIRVANVDINRGVLKRGMRNHQLSGIETKGVSFLAYDILHAFSRLGKKIRADMVIIDPPSMQRAFNLFKDYRRIADKLPMVLEKNATVIATANHPEFNEEELKAVFAEYDFIEAIPPQREYKNVSLTTLVFQFNG